MIRQAAALVFAGLLGALAALGQQPFSMWWFTVLALSFLFFLHKRSKTRWRAAVLLWFFALGYFGIALRWILEPFQVEAEVFGWMAPIALIAMAAGLALFWGVAGYASKFLTSSRNGSAEILVLTLAAGELARAYLFTGFPWAGLAQIWVGTDAALLLATIGPHGLGLFTLVLAALPWLTWRLPALAFVALISAFGFLSHQSEPQEDESAPVIRLVQPNAPQHEKWDREKAPLFFSRQLEATRAEGDPDLIIWPETAIPRLLNYAETELEIVSQAAGQTPVVIGMQREQSGNYYNSLIVLEGGKIGQVFDKHHLVPFGEYMPFPEFFKSLGIRALAQRAQSGYSAGQGPQVIELPGLGKAAALICYEAVFPRHSQSRQERARLILQVTNDAWFGTYAGPQQHLAQAQMRAIEQGLPFVRSANTGVSAIINAHGEITAQLPLGVHGHIDAVLPAALGPTIYAQTGDLPFAIILLLALIGATFQFVFRNTD